VVSSSGWAEDGAAASSAVARLVDVEGKSWVHLAAGRPWSPARYRASAVLLRSGWLETTPSRGHSLLHGNASARPEDGTPAEVAAGNRLSGRP